MAEILALKRSQPSPGQINGFQNPRYRKQWKCEMDGPSSAGEVIVKGQETSNSDHDPLPLQGELYTDIGFTDEGAQALDFTAEPQRGANHKWDITVVYRPPTPGAKESPQDIQFWIDLTANPLPDFTTVEELEAHDAKYIWERWTDTQEYAFENDQAYLVDPDTGEAQTELTKIRNVNGDPFPDRLTTFPDFEMRQTISIERLVGSPISSFWLNQFYGRQTNATQVRFAHLGKELIFAPRSLRYIKSATGRIQWWKNRPYFRCVTEVEVIGTEFGATFEQRGRRYIQSIEVPVDPKDPDGPKTGRQVWKEATDWWGGPIDAVALQADGFKYDPLDLDPDAEQAPPRTYRFYAENQFFQALVGPPAAVPLTSEENHAE